MFIYFDAENLSERMVTKNCKIMSDPGIRLENSSKCDFTYDHGTIY